MPKSAPVNFMGEFEGSPVSPAGPGGRGTQAQAQAQAAPRGPQPRPPATTVNTADLEYFTAISSKYREITGIRSAGFTRTPAGAFFEYGYYQFGVPSFSTPGWGLAGGSRPVGQVVSEKSGSDIATHTAIGVRLYFRENS